MKKISRLVLAASFLIGASAFAEDLSSKEKELNFSGSIGAQNGKTVGTLSMRAKSSKTVLREDCFAVENKTLNLEIHGGQTYLRSVVSSDLYPVTLWGTGESSIVDDSTINYTIFSIMLIPTVDADMMNRLDREAFRAGRIFLSADVVGQVVLRGVGTGSPDFSERDMTVSLSSYGWNVNAKARAGVGGGAVVEGSTTGTAAVVHAGGEVEALYLKAKVTADIVGRGSMSVKGVQFIGKAKYLRAIAYTSASNTQNDWTSGREVSGEANYLFVPFGKRVWNIGVKGSADRFDIKPTAPGVVDTSSGRVYYLGAQLGVNL